MRRNLHSALSLILLLSGLCFACNSGKQNEIADGTSHTIDSTLLEGAVPLTDSIVERLFWSLPTVAKEASDMSRSEQISASVAAALIKEAKELVTLESPLRTAYYASSIFGEFCDREKTAIDSIEIRTSNDSVLANVYVRYCYVGYSGSREFSNIVATLNLVHSPEGQWLMDDFAIGHGHFKSEVTEFIKKQRICFYAPEWREWFVNERFEGRYPRYKMKEKPTSVRMLQSIKEYLKAFPDSASVAPVTTNTFSIETSPEIARQLKISGLSEARIHALFNAIPGATSRNPACNLTDPKRAYSKQLSALINHAFELPNDGFGNEGSKSQLNYLVNTQEDDLVFVWSTHILPVSEDFVSAYLTVAHVQGFNVTLAETNIQLVRENGEWLIADFGCSQQLMQYIARQRRFFRSEEWANMVESERKHAAQEEDKSLRNSWIKAIDQNVAEVEAYFAKYPDR